MTDDALAQAVAAAMAAILGFPVTGDPPERVTGAATAAVTVARRYLYGDGPAVDPPVDLPSSADVLAGLTALGVRIYHDPSSPAGVMGSEAFIGTPIAEDLLAHVHHYLNPYRQAWGIA